MVWISTKERELLLQLPLRATTPKHPSSKHLLVFPSSRTNGNCQGLRARVVEAEAAVEAAAAIARTGAEHPNERHDDVTQAVLGHTVRALEQVADACDPMKVDAKHWAQIQPPSLTAIRSRNVAVCQGSIGSLPSSKSTSRERISNAVAVVEEAAAIARSSDEKALGKVLECSIQALEQVTQAFKVVSKHDAHELQNTGITSNATLQGRARPRVPCLNLAGGSRHEDSGSLEASQDRCCRRQRVLAALESLENPAGTASHNREQMRSFIRTLRAEDLDWFLQTILDDRRCAVASARQERVSLLPMVAHCFGQGLVISRGIQDHILPFLISMLWWSDHQGLTSKVFCDLLEILAPDGCLEAFALLAPNFLEALMSPLAYPDADPVLRHGCATVLADLVPIVLDKATKLNQEAQSAARLADLLVRCLAASPRCGACHGILRAIGKLCLFHSDSLIPYVGRLIDICVSRLMVTPCGLLSSPYGCASPLGDSDELTTEVALACCACLRLFREQVWTLLPSNSSQDNLLRCESVLQALSSDNRGLHRLIESGRTLSATLSEAIESTQKAWLEVQHMSGKLSKQSPREPQPCNDIAYFNHRLFNGAGGNHSLHLADRDECYYGVSRQQPAGGSLILSKHGGRDEAQITSQNILEESQSGLYLCTDMLDPLTLASPDAVSDALVSNDVSPIEFHRRSESYVEANREEMQKQGVQVQEKTEEVASFAVSSKTMHNPSGEIAVSVRWPRPAGCAGHLCQDMQEKAAIPSQLGQFVPIPRGELVDHRNHSALANSRSQHAVPESRECKHNIDTFPSSLGSCEVQTAAAASMPPQRNITTTLDRQKISGSSNLTTEVRSADCCRVPRPGGGIPFGFAIDIVESSAVCKNPPQRLQSQLPTFISSNVPDKKVVQDTRKGKTLPASGIGDASTVRGQEASIGRFAGRLTPEYVDSGWKSADRATSAVRDFEASFDAIRNAEAALRNAEDGFAAEKAHQETSTAARFSSSSKVARHAREVPDQEAVSRLQKKQLGKALIEMRVAKLAKEDAEAALMWYSSPSADASTDDLRRSSSPASFHVQKAQELARARSKILGSLMQGVSADSLSQGDGPQLALPSTLPSVAPPLRSAESEIHASPSSQVVNRTCAFSSLLSSALDSLSISPARRASMHRNSGGWCAAACSGASHAHARHKSCHSMSELLAEPEFSHIPTSVLLGWPSSSKHLGHQGGVVRAKSPPCTGRRLD